MSQEVIFLFGAGASVDAGVPTSNEITDIMLNYGSYCPSRKGIAIENLLKYIQVKVANYFQVKASNVNFEYLLGNLIELSRRNESPTVPLLGDGDTLLKKFEDEIPFNEVIDEMYALLRELLFINRPVDYLYYLKAFLDLSRPLDIFTLNYDLSLEMAFKELKIRYTTGYNNIEGKSSVWDPSEFERKDSFDVRIFKLHGSLDWGTSFGYAPPSRNSEINQEDIICSAIRYMNSYPARIKFDIFQPDIVKHPSCESGLVSIMNFGTRKELLYASSQFNLLFNHFVKSLQNAKVCVIAGYSFRDDRINDAIMEAVITRKGQMHLIIVDPFADSVIQSDPRLKALHILKWMTKLNMTLSESFISGKLIKSIRIDKEAENILDLIQECSEFSKDRSDHPFNDLIRSLEHLRLNINLTYFWIQYTLPRINDVIKSDKTTDSKAAQIGYILLPLIRKARDLCYCIDKAYKYILGCHSSDDPRYFTWRKLH